MSNSMLLFDQSLTCLITCYYYSRAGHVRWRHLQGVSSVYSSRVDGLVHVCQQEGEKYQEAEHGEEDTKHHLEWSDQQLTPAEKTPRPLVEVPVLPLQQPPLLL